MEKKNPIEEARRYVDNAKDILKEKGDLDTALQSYTDSKYVKMAGNTLWNGVLFILDAVFHVKKNKKHRPDISDYQQAAAARDKKLLMLVNNGYNILHLNMGYDGVLDKTICDRGFQIATEIIDRCAVMLPFVPAA
jgi:mannose-1-phosphate guanylyltransferase